MCGSGLPAESRICIPGLVPYDLTRGGTPFQFSGSANINQYAFYIQDSIRFGNLQLQAGLRVDFYHGIVTDSSAQPRIGVSYLIKPTGTVIRASYSRTFETPYNENLMLSSATGVGGLAVERVRRRKRAPAARKPQSIQRRTGTGVRPISGGERGLLLEVHEQCLRLRHTVQHSHRLPDLLEEIEAGRRCRAHRHTESPRLPVVHDDGPYPRAILSDRKPAAWSSTTTSAATLYFRIDHDQAFQQTTNLRYQHGNNGPWVAFTWRYDSGLVAGAVGSLDDALGLTGAQQSAIGFFCGSSLPTIDTPLTDAECTPSNYGATRLVIPKEGTENDDHNPPRVAPRHLFDIGVGTDNLFHTERIPDHPALRRHQSHEQGGALQLSVHLQRNALRDAARVPGRDRTRILML